MDHLFQTVPDVLPGHQIHQGNGEQEQHRHEVHKPWNKSSHACARHATIHATISGFLCVPLDHLKQKKSEIRKDRIRYISVLRYRSQIYLCVVPGSAWLHTPIPLKTVKLINLSDQESLAGVSEHGGIWIHTVPLTLVCIRTVSSVWQLQYKIVQRCTKPSFRKNLCLMMGL